MKNKIYNINILFGIFFVFFSNVALSDKFEFNASKVESYNKGNLIKGSGGVEINDGLDLIIVGDEFEFDKLKAILKVSGNILITDKLNRNLIKSDEIIFYKKLNIVKSEEKTIVELGSNHTIKSSNITFNRNLNTLFSSEKTQITDLDNNKFNTNNFRYSITEKIFKADNIKISDSSGNIYDLENFIYNIKTNEILGKDLNLNFNSDNLDSNENEPRLKGNAFFYNGNISQISKGVFTNCKKNDSCPPWVLNAENIKHDKIKKQIYYKNAWLKVYDVPVFYFPRFFHPDPTIKRQSGFLMPKFSQSSNTGNFFTTPYFNVISEAADLTFSPRAYDNGTAIYQSEYRSINKKSAHIADFSVKNKSTLNINEIDDSSAAHFFLNSKFDLDFYNFEETRMDIQIQETSNDDYLKIYKLKSPLIGSENNLHSSINFNASREDLDLEITAEKYENLTVSEKYEFIYPSISILKNIYESSAGNLTLNTTGQNKQFNTNTNEKIVTNDLNYKSYNKINMLGVVSNYEILLKNFNAKSKRSTTYKNKTESTLQSIVNYEMKYPLQKIKGNFVSTFTPTFSARYSPNKSKNKSLNDRIMNFDNMFSLNRIGVSDTVEGGQSITIGNEYALYRGQNTNEKIFSIDLATSIRDKKNDKLPINSTLGKKNSDVFGKIEFNANEFIDFDYNFALDNNLQTINYNQIKSTLSFLNIVSTFDFLEKNNLLGSESYISNETKVEINQSSSIGFKTRKNKDKNLTEYYNLLYEYKNDCLIAGIEFKKDFYSDGSLKPEEQLFFSVTIMPFGKFNTPDMNQ